jgi:hypothetical protein
VVVSTAQHRNWISLLIAAVFAVGATIAAIKVWNDEPVNRRNSTAQEEGLSVLKVTMAPTAVGFWALGLGIVTLNLGGRTDASTGDLVLLVIACVMGVIFVVAVAVAFSLFLFTKPAALVPPSMRR